MDQQVSTEAKIYKALDKLEAVIQHNEADIATWIPLEYDLQLSYGTEQVAFSDYFIKLKEEINRCTRQKIMQSE
ncbi:HD domain-containing protein [Roseburia hominis]|nr:HD domain-containing protein [Roseburia hominis]MCI5713566.1 HD domain-containing protein [Lachnospiraceae bacterium]